MKRTLAYDRHAKQFRADVDGKRFYLGGDAAEAERRKLLIVRYRASQFDWNPVSLDNAKRLAKGEAATAAPTDNAAAQVREELRLAAAGVPVQKRVTVTGDDVHALEVQELRARIAELEAELREHAGPRVAERTTVTVAEVLRAWHRHREQTIFLPGTTTNPDAVRGNGTMVEYIIRQLPDPALRLADLDYHALDVLCKRLASRPVAQRTGKPVSRPWARESMKAVRQVLKWASKTYGYRKPEDYRISCIPTVPPT